MVRKIKLTHVKFKTYPIGSTLTVGKKGILKADADTLIKWNNAEEVTDDKLPEKEGGK